MSSNVDNVGTDINITIREYIVTITRWHTQYWNIGKLQEKMYGNICGI